MSINFINPVSKKRCQEVRMWRLITYTLCATTVVGSLAVFALQLGIYHALKKEKNALTYSLASIANGTNDTSNLCAQLATLKPQVEKMNKIQSHTKDPITILMGLLSAKAVSCQTIRITKNNIEFSGCCSHPQQASDCINSLKSHKDFHNLTISSLQSSSHNGWSFIIKGNA